VAIKWSPLRVSQAMDEVERQIALAEGFISEAKARAEEARKIPNLPQYMDTRLISLINHIERLNRINYAIEAIRRDIPEQDLADEQKLAQYGSQQGLSL